MTINLCRDAVKPIQVHLEEETRRQKFCALSVIDDYDISLVARVWFERHVVWGRQHLENCHEVKRDTTSGLIVVVKKVPAHDELEQNNIVCFQIRCVESVLPVDNKGSIINIIERYNLDLSVNAEQ
jgi:hypothetical protein